jgi:hypothetical protein
MWRLTYLVSEEGKRGLAPESLEISRHVLSRWSVIVRIAEERTKAISNTDILRNRPLKN